MKRWRQFLEKLPVSSRLGWAAVFVLGVFSGVLLGAITGLPSKVDASPGEIDEGPNRLRTMAVRMAGEPIAESIAPATLNVTPEPSTKISLGAVDTSHTPVFAPASNGSVPQIAVIIDDLGLDRGHFDAANALPGPVNLSFLPYGKHAQSMVDDVAGRHEVMMHLPMEPTERMEDAGPGVLMTSNSDAVIAQLLAYNLDKLSGFKGVNNHTGSKFTGDPRAMYVVLSELNRRGLYFVDSMTVNRHVAEAIGRRKGWRVEERDIFLDDGWPDVSVESVREQLEAAERIAVANGHAVVIGHPYRATMQALSDWMVEVDGKGIELVRVSELFPPTREEMLAVLR